MGSVLGAGSTAAWGLCSDVYDGGCFDGDEVLWRPARRPRRAWLNERHRARIRRGFHIRAVAAIRAVGDGCFLVSRTLQFDALRVVEGGGWWR